jgi:hypothetical protein
MQEELGFPDKADKRAQPGSGWTPATLNRILHKRVVSGELTTFGCVGWQSQLFRGSMPAAIRLTCRRNVFMALILRYANILWMLRYVSVHTSIYTDVRYFYAQDTVVIAPPYPYSRDLWLSWQSDNLRRG